MLAGKGYAVLQPNYRGSTGYGDPFLRDMVGHYFQNAHLDVMTGVDELIRRGIADPDRLVKMGWSGGGHMTNKIVTFTDRFKAASSGAGAANWISMYAQSDIRFQRTPWFGGTPWQKNAPIDVYWNHSPLKDVANVKTPTLFFVGEKRPARADAAVDRNVPRAQVERRPDAPLHRAARAARLGELRHQLFKMNAEIEWFEKHATGRPYTPEKVPEEKKDGQEHQRAIGHGSVCYGGPSRSARADTSYSSLLSSSSSSSSTSASSPSSSSSSSSSVSGKLSVSRIGPLVHFGNQVVIVLVHGRTSDSAIMLTLVDAKRGPPRGPTLSVTPPAEKGARPLFRSG